MAHTRCGFCDIDVHGSFRFCPECGRELAPSTGASDDPLVGTVFGGKYRVTERVGSGGMGTVYKAEHVTLEKLFAVKVLRSTLKDDPELVQRFHAEARLASRLSHPNCISVVDFGETEGGTLFLVAEFVRGIDLIDVMRRDAPLELKRVARIARQMLAGLAEAHSLGIVHRDLKHENIMVETVPGQGDFVKILDFGIARIVTGAGGITRPGLAMGTPDYMPPEQISGHPATPASDLYSAGVVLYRMLTGRVPFRGDTQEVLTGHLLHKPRPPSELRAEIPPALDAVVLRALAKRPEERFASALDFQSALDACVADTPLTSTRAATRSPETADPPLCGRDAELARIKEALGAERPAPILVVGPPGSGRTRLLREAAAVAREAGRRSLVLEPSMRGRDGPVGPVARVLDEADAAIGGLDTPERVAAALREVIEAGAILLVDDMEALPWLCRDGVARLIAGPPAGAVVVTAARRPAGASDSEVLGLGSLSDVDARILAQAIGGAAAAAEAWGGLPLELVERARFRERFDVEAPPTVEEVTATRVRMLPPAALHTAQALAVLGGAAPVARMEAMVADVSPVYPIVRDGHELRFVHDYITECVHASIPTEVRRELHARAARVEEREGAFVGTVAFHLEAAEAPEAVGALEQAGDASTEAGDRVDAAGFFRRAFDRLRASAEPSRDALARLAVRYADALDALSNRPRAAGLLREALEAAGGDGATTALLRWRLGRLALDAGRADLALDELEEARRQLPRVADRDVTAEIWGTLARALAEMGHLDRALDAAREAARVASDERRWRHLLLAAELQLRSGRRDAGVREIGEALRQAERVGGRALDEARELARRLDSDA